MTESSPRCDPLLPYFLKELDLEASDAFEQHLDTCAACKEQLAELQQVWQTLPYEMEEVEVPEAMKSQMLERIMDELGLDDISELSPEPKLVTQLQIPTEKKLVPWYRKHFFPAAAAILIVVGAVAVWGANFPFGAQGHIETTVGPKTPGGEQYTLKPFDPSMPAAKGTAWIEHQGDAKKLVLKMNGLQGNAGEQAYQLWVIKEGKRYNGGTFRADAGGNAVLTYDLQAIQGSFEALGITLEPDAQGVQPRGKKVLGT
jgi:hypothetical protein